MNLRLAIHKVEVISRTTDNVQLHIHPVSSITSTYDTVSSAVHSIPPAIRNNNLLLVGAIDPAHLHSSTTNYYLCCPENPLCIVTREMLKGDKLTIPTTWNINLPPRRKVKQDESKPLDATSTSRQSLSTDEWAN